MLFMLKEVVKVNLDLLSYTFFQKCFAIGLATLLKFSINKTIQPNFLLFVLNYAQFHHHHCHCSISFSNSQNKVRTTTKQLPSSSKYARSCSSIGIFYLIYLHVDIIKTYSCLLRCQANKSASKCFFKDATACKSRI